jgi:hypothetical protein
MLSFIKGLFFGVIGTLDANLLTPHIINPTNPNGIPNSNQLRCGGCPTVQGITIW